MCQVHMCFRPFCLLLIQTEADSPLQEAPGVVDGLLAHVTHPSPFEALPREDVEAPCFG